MVFHSQQRQSIVIPKYVLLVACNGFLSYGLIELLHHTLGFRTIPAKLFAESLLFVANFAVQRDFVFTRRQPARTATDWDQYYTRVPVTARLTRQYTTAVLVELIRRYGQPASTGTGLCITEIGGANSCFLDQILSKVQCSSYNVVDTNAYGLALLKERSDGRGVVHLHQQSVLDLKLPPSADLVFSVGLVEHFTQNDTRRAVLAHFDALRPGGTAIITFPTPTLLYRVARHIIEIMGMWKFPDERPLGREEVVSAIRECGNVAHEGTLWPLILTQGIVVATKRGAARAYGQT